MGEWTAIIPGSGIECSSNEILRDIKEVTLDDDDILTSFDVTSLYTNVPVEEAIALAADKLYDDDSITNKPPVDKATFRELARLCSTNILLQTHDGYFRQTDGLVMGTPPAMQFSNLWLKQYEPTIFANSKLKRRYVDDIICTTKRNATMSKLDELNSLHPNLKFTVEIEKDGRLPFLDMAISRDDQNRIHADWYRKDTDTGLLLNYHAIAPKKYKRTVVTGMVHRIYNATSSWSRFHHATEEAKTILENNQFPPAFYDPLIKNVVEQLADKTKGKDVKDVSPGGEKTGTTPHMLRLQYRGHATDRYIGKLRKAEAPILPVLTTRKLRSCLPSLKVQSSTSLRSRVVYRITCSGCNSCYVGATTQHLTTRVQQHRVKGTPVRKHFDTCKQKVNMDQTEIVDCTIRGDEVLLALEALHIRELNPQINTRDEYRSRKLTLKF